MVCSDTNVSGNRGKKNIEESVGVDLGIKDLVILSDGTKYQNPKSEKKFREKIKRLNRSLSNKVYGSKNWHKTKKELSVMHHNVTNVRKDVIHKITTEISNKYNLIVLEDLKIKTMQKDKNYAKYLYDASLYSIRKFFEYKANKVKYVSTYYPSSQICSSCNFRNEKLSDVKIRYWECPRCKTIHDRDINAAKNILVAASHEFKP